MLEKGTSYFGVRDIEHVEADLDRFCEQGLNAVLHTFSECDREYYTETMADIVAASHDRDMRVYVNPWAVGRVFGGEALSEFVGRHPDSCQELSTGERIPAACFNDPTFREYMREWTADAAEIGADVLFWDEPHWYIPEWFDDEIPDGSWTCRCTSCQQRYEEQYDEEMPATQTEQVDEFREQSLLSFLDEMMELAANVGCENAVCLLPSEDADHGLSDWEQLAANDFLDILVTDPYWTVFDRESDAFVTTATDTVVSLAEEYDLESQIWIQGFRLDSGSKTTDDVRTATRAAVDGGVDSVFMWGYDACRTISSIACEDPDAVWNAYLDELPSSAP
ncbi:hypothetical protein C482_03061 [Natrialba chahannaoensis JCM 10990]|uniref:Uncharacterized protein n=1 Tax=Natrialba chahannaoensis JCM 10990 TaxID=1227492 RepID=M0B1T0_9EURY|nr:hypothetical protein [Natrialba chahannaoensis]ELZ04740.1 hypothetical protein C482_03061 [Natrialba chahannaoensis JCM 10990]